MTCPASPDAPTAGAGGWIRAAPGAVDRRAFHTTELDAAGLLVERCAFHTTKRFPLGRQVERHPFHTTEETADSGPDTHFLRRMERLPYQCRIHSAAERPVGGSVSAALGVSMPVGIQRAVSVSMADPDLQFQRSDPMTAI